MATQVQQLQRCNASLYMRPDRLGLGLGLGLGLEASLYMRPDRLAKLP